MYRKALAVLAVGYLLYYFSERVFCTHFSLEDTFVTMLFAWLMYSIVAWFTMALIARFRPVTLSQWILIGAMYGWIVEGVLADTLYTGLPLSVSVTGLSWNMLVAVLVGLYGFSQALQARTVRPLLFLTTTFGIFAGLWGLEGYEAEGFLFGPFIVHLLINTLLFVAAWRIVEYSGKRTVRCGLLDLCLASFLLAVFFTITIMPNYWYAPFVILPLLLGSLFVLWRFSEPGNICPTMLPGSISFTRYMLLLVVPVVAVSMQYLYLLTGLPTSYPPTSHSLYDDGCWFCGLWLGTLLVVHWSSCLCTKATGGVS
jgi:hypothetical protein